MVHAGDGTGWIRNRGGKLFDPVAFPFLEGRYGPEVRHAPAPVTDGFILRVLDGLLMLDGEKLSYRTLDVEQIGSVYETVMGFTALSLPGPALAIKAGKYNRTPAFVDLAALAAKKGKDREKHLKEKADRGQLPPRVATALAGAEAVLAIADALQPIVDERGSPGAHASPPSAPLLQPTDERRRTGSHYSPRSGDTRESRLRALIAEDGVVISATRRLPWPGEAAVVVSVVHVVKGTSQCAILDWRQVRRISAYLVEGDLDTSPARLAANAGKASLVFIF